MQEKNKLKQMYLIATALTLLIIIPEYILLSRFMESQDHAALMINVSGKQRMLSQRSALWAERLEASSTPQEAEKAKVALKQIRQEMLQSHAMLTDSKTHLGSVTHSNKHLMRLYFESPVHLDAQVHHFARHLDRLVHKPLVLLREQGHDFKQVQSESDDLLKGFDTVVSVFQKANAEDLKRLQYASLSLCVSVLLIIAGLWRMVFRPMLRNVNETMRLMQIQQKVVTAANEAETIQTSLQVAVDSICEYMKWPVGHVYLYSEDNKTLQSTGVWHLEDEKRYEAFRQVSQNSAYATREDFVGEIFGDATPMWILDVAHSHVYNRQEAAKSCGLKAAFGFPIFVGKKAEAVMEFYATESRIPDDTLLHMMANIGKQLGQTIERAQFQERAQLLETIIKSANDGIVITKADMSTTGPEIVYVNEAFSIMTGYAPEEVIGKSPRMLQGEFTKRETLDALRAALEAGAPFKDELLNVTKDGRHYWLDISIVPIRNSLGALTHFAAIERDITAKKQEEMNQKNMWMQLKRANLKAEATSRDLVESLKKAEEANKAKSDFLANMSHELRTPMNGVLGMASLLTDTPLNPEQKQYVSTINGSAENLLMLLNDILDFSKIEAGALVLENIAFGFKETLEMIANLLRPQAERKGVSVLVDCAADVPAYVWGDPGRFRQVIMNLLGNGIKFTEHGYVRVGAAIEETDGKNRVRITVEDTGMGIPAHKLGEIFEKFTQGDASVTRKYGGTGLGLAISKQLVTLMGGTIGVQSVEGKGSTFWLSLPLETASQGDIVSAAENGQIRCQAVENCIPVAEGKVLLVEDYHVNQVFAEKLLRKFGFRHIDVAENGVAALLKYRTQTYDIIFMDCQMPELDGYQTTQKIRLLEEATPLHTPIVAMTANAMMGDREKCLKAGMDDYLSKPLRAEHLKKIIEMWFKIQEDKGEITSEKSMSLPEAEDAPVDMEQLRLFTDGDLEEEKALAELFLSQAQDMIAILQQSLSTQTQEAWKSAAHRFKGSSGNLGAMKLHHLCRRAEAHSEESAASKQEMLEAIIRETRRVEDFFAAAS